MDKLNVESRDGKFEKYFHFLAVYLGQVSLNLSLSLHSYLSSFCQMINLLIEKCYGRKMSPFHCTYCNCNLDVTFQYFSGL